MDDFGVAPILGNLEIYRKLQVHSSNSLIHMDTRSIKITHFFPSMFWPCTRFSEWFRADSPCLSVNSCSISYHRGCSDQLGSVNVFFLVFPSVSQLILFLCPCFKLLITRPMYGWVSIFGISHRLGQKESVTVWFAQVLSHRGALRSFSIAAAPDLSAQVSQSLWDGASHSYWPG